MMAKANFSARTLQYREGLIGVLIAIVIELANYLFFKHSSAGSQLAITVAVIGFLLTVLRSALHASMLEELQPVKKLAEIVDLQSDSNLDIIDGMMKRYLSVTEAEFRPVKEQIVAEAGEQLRRLAIEKRSPTLQTSDYYDWIFRQFDALRPGDYVHAVSLSSDTEWNDSQLEKNFLAKNIVAASIGAQISRIFIVEDARISSFLSLPPIDAHTAEAETGLEGFLVSKDYLLQADRDALASVGEGFLDFNGHVALEDRFDPNGKARGQVTMLQSDLDKMRRLYDRLMHMSKPLHRE